MRFAYLLTCALLPGILFAQDDSKVVALRMTGSNTKIERALLTFELKATSENRKFTLTIDPSNDISSVIDSITVQPQASVTITPVVEAKKPHKITLLFAKSDKQYWVTIQEKAVAGRMRYRVSTDKDHHSQAVAELVIENKSNYSFNKVDLTFDSGGIFQTFDDSLDLAQGDSAFFKLATTSTSKAVDLKKPITDENAPEPNLLKLKPLGYWVKASDFKKGVAKADLKFPMKGNWPEYTIPGDILFEYQGRRLADFELPTNAPDATFTTVTTEDESYTFSSTQPEVQAETDYASVDLSEWPKVSFDVKFVSKLNPVWVVLDAKSTVFVDSSPKVGAKDYIQFQFHAAVNVKSADIKKLLDSVNKIPATVSGSDLNKLKTKLAKTYADLHSKEKEFRDLIENIVNGVEVEENRSKLNQAQKEVRDIVDGYREWVKKFRNQ